MTHCSTFSKLLLAVFLIFPVTTAFCQQASNRVNPCQSPEVTAFDFQVGIWQEVDGASVHEVKKILGGCVIQENWTGGSLNAFSHTHAQQIIKVPQGNGTPVLIDGKISVDEWRDAAVITAAPSIKLYLKQFRGHVFIGLKMRTASPSYVDMFLLTGDNQLYNLHASMQVGERLLTDDAWSDTSPPNHWGNHVDWIGSEAKIDAEKDRNLPMAKRLFPYDGMEFQLRRARFVGKQWRIRIEVRDFAGQVPDIIFPRISERKNTTPWAILSLGVIQARPNKSFNGRSDSTSFMIIPAADVERHSQHLKKEESSKAPVQDNVEDHHDNLLLGCA